MPFGKLSQSLHNFHNDEKGDVIQVVLVVALAAILMAAVAKYTNETVWAKAVEKMKLVIGTNPTTGGAATQ